MQPDLGGRPGSVHAAPTTTVARVDIGRVGVWWSGRFEVDGRPDVDTAAEIEALGYGAMWSTGGFKPGLSSRFGRLLSSSSRLAAASGIVSVWATPPAVLADAVAELDARFPGRFVLGLGASHGAVVEGYHHPLSKVAEYLDALDALAPSVPAVGRDRRVLAALGPRMLELAAHRAAGAHPYLAPVEHTARARAALGPGPLLAPEVTAVLDTEPASARAQARSFVAGYLTLPNYAGNLRRLGFGDDDLAGGGSDRLLDAVVARGDADAVAARVAEHHDAGANHVCLQVLAPLDGFPLAQYRELAGALGLG